MTRPMLLPVLHRATVVVVLAVLLVCAISLAWYLVVAFVGSTAPFQRGYARARQTLMRATGAIFAGYGTRLMLQQ